MPWNFFMTAEVLSWVMMWYGRMETKSPARSGRLGPSARCACAIFSTTVWSITNSRIGNTLLPCHPERGRALQMRVRVEVEPFCGRLSPQAEIRTAKELSFRPIRKRKVLRFVLASRARLALAQDDIQQKLSAVTGDTSATALLRWTFVPSLCWLYIRFQQSHQLAY